MQMLSFDSTDEKYLKHLITSAIGKPSNSAIIQKLESLLAKVDSLTNEEFTVTITSQEVEEAELLMTELDNIFTNYSKARDIADLITFDTIKKEATGRLVRFSTLKDKFITEANYLEDVYKHEKRTSIGMKILNDDPNCKSINQAEKLVLADKRYTLIRDDVRSVRGIASKIKTKYDFFLRTLQLVHQSVSNATKERDNSNKENSA